jgi:nucleoside phosphorylase/tetratricopeptide (TPR) repeat protein
VTERHREVKPVMASVRKTHADYTMAWICALPLEAAAATAMLNEIHPKLSQPAADDNAYTLGEIAGHNVLIVCLPLGVYGTTSAATVAAQMRSTFSSVRFGLMVGIGGGVPGTKNGIRLGDIVVSKPTGVSGGVVQYDYGKTVASGALQRTGMMNQPPQVLLNAIARLQADKLLGNNQSIIEMVSDALNGRLDMKHHCSRPVQEQDHLYDAAYQHHQNEDTCIRCDKEQLVYRKIRNLDEPQVHYGLIASGNQVIKDGLTRDRLAKEHGILCFEMEAAGLMNQLPCLVIRGICDYCDSHKNKQWQGYAAIIAAAYTKILLSVVPVNQLQKDRILQKACWMVPFERNRRFLGRQEAIFRLENMILSKDQTRKAAIAGLGGVGKTQIALELAHRVRDQDPTCSIFWIPSTSMEAVEQAFMSISEQLGLQNVTPADVKTQVKAWLSLETAGLWLLIIDNADDIDMWVSSKNSSLALKSFLPQSQHGFTLFTTRNQQLATDLVGPDIISVSEMDDVTAKDLLKASLVRKELLKDDNSATMLVQQLSGLPLALIQAASYINRNLISLDTYLSLLNNQESEMVELLSQDFQDDWRYKDIKNPVAVTWLISFYQIQALNSLAADYLSFMSCIDPRDIPQSLLPPADSRTKQQNALGLLRGYAFITGQADNRFLSLHRLVHLATRNWLRSEEILEQCASKAGKRLVEIFPSDAPENRMLWREYLSHGQFILGSPEFQGETEEREDLAYKVATCLDSDGRYHEAEILFKEILESKRENLEDDDPSTLTSMANLASTYRNQGRWTEAEKLEVQVMETRKTVLGPEHPDTLTSMANLASTYRNQGRWTEAEKLEVQVMETSKTVLGPEHPDTLTSMWNLSHTWKRQGRDTDALELLSNCVLLQHEKLGHSHPDTISATANLKDWQAQPKNRKRCRK